MMFAIAKRFSVKEATKAFRMCVFWSVRFLVVGGRGGLLDTNDLLTQDAAKYDTWGVREISERQRKMAKLALKTWPLALP